MNKFTVTFLSFCLFLPVTLFAQKLNQGRISGNVIEKTSDKPLEFANITLKNLNDSANVQGTVSGSNGEFVFEKLPFGKYTLVCSFIGFEKNESSVITIDAKQSKADLGKVYISESASTLKEVEVTGRKSTFVNSIDRKTFNVGEDLMSKTGSVSELLQNVPSVQVDIDGNVSLRGSENVTVLINGKPSAMMNLNRAAVLQQMSANSIEKIEVITNPSAKYKPDGVSGIINIVLKKNKSLGWNGNMIANVGNNERYNGNVSINYNPGRLNLFGSIGVRQDDRIRINDIITQTSLNNTQTSLAHTHSESTGRPVSDIVNLGADVKINEKNKVSVSANYNYRYQRQSDISVYTRDSLLISRDDYNRNRRLPEFESDLELTSSYQHNFGKEGHELNLNYTTSATKENEDNYYTNIYRLPVPQTNFDNMFYHHTNNQSQFLAEYTSPISKNSKIESGYELDYINNSMDLHRDTTSMNMTGYGTDDSRSNTFVRSEYTHVLYLTYQHEIGPIGLLAGLRGEQSYTTANLETKNTVLNNRYSRLYPTLHLTYKVNAVNELQLNYSHRIRRPEDEQLNPFPEYQDMRNIRAGNPYLKPEDIHSFEVGYQYKKQSATFISTAYYRYNYNGITSITRISGDTLFSTLENLSKSTSAGLELIVSASFGKLMNVNLSSNTFYNVIDASSLGYSKNKADISFSVNGIVGINLSKTSVWQITSNYTGEQLTPQGKRLPSFVMNTGFKQEIFKKKAAIIVTISDVFNSMRNTMVVDTQEVYEKMMRKRSSRVVYAGFSYSFGYSAKKAKENSLKFDNQL